MNNLHSGLWLPWIKKIQNRPLNVRSLHEPLHLYWRSLYWIHLNSKGEKINVFVMSMTEVGYFWRLFWNEFANNSLIWWNFQSTHFFPGGLAQVLIVSYFANQHIYNPACTGFFNEWRISTNWSVKQYNLVNFSESSNSRIKFDCPN